MIFRKDRIDNGFHLGFEIYLHRHGVVYQGGIAGRGETPIHFHLMITFAFWYFELTIGKEDSEEN